MEAPENDIKDRQPVWDEMQMLFMDIDIDDLLPEIAKVCAESKYRLEELESIFFDEVFPACRFNMWCMPAPEWEGFEINWLTEQILKKQRHGKRRLIVNRKYATIYWEKLKNCMVELDKL